MYFTRKYRKFSTVDVFFLMLPRTTFLKQKSFIYAFRTIVNEIYIEIHFLKNSGANRL